MPINSTLQRTALKQDAIRCPVGFWHRNTGGVFLLVFLSSFSASVFAGMLDAVPKIESASQGLMLIKKDSFASIKLAGLLQQKASIKVEEVGFNQKMGSGFHGISLTENFGRITLAYMVSVDKNNPNSEQVFDLTKEALVEYFSALGVGNYAGNEKLNNMTREYRWSWESGAFLCEVTYSYWEQDEPYRLYECNSEN